MMMLSFFVNKDELLCAAGRIPFFNYAFSFGKEWHVRFRRVDYKRLILLFLCCIASIMSVVYETKTK